MAVTLYSTRFGTLVAPEEALIEFPCGLIGLPGTRYALLPANEDAPFLWLHSIEDSKLAIPLTNPFRHFDGYEVELSGGDAARIGIGESGGIAIYVTVRAAALVGEFSANLRAPLIVSNGRGHQIINQSPDAPISAPFFHERRTATRRAAWA